MGRMYVHMTDASDRGILYVRIAHDAADPNKLVLNNDAEEETRIRGHVFRVGLPRSVEPAQETETLGFAQTHEQLKPCEIIQVKWTE